MSFDEIWMENGDRGKCGFLLKERAHNCEILSRECIDLDLSEELITGGNQRFISSKQWHQSGNKKGSGMAYLSNQRFW
jgi:hypothetical protein